MHKKEYSAWNSMLTRCTNSSNHGFKTYGAIGVKVCERWKRFEYFIQDMGACPAGYSLDRIDPFGNYEPENCRWADRQTQAENKRSNVIYNGKRRTIKSLAREFSMTYETLFQRIQRGWSVETSVSVPIEKQKKLSVDSVTDIRNTYKGRKRGAAVVESLARKYGVGASCIYKVISSESWSKLA